MERPIHELVPEGPVEAMEQFQSLACALSASLQYILNAMKIAENDLGVYQELARKIVMVTRQSSQLQLSEVVNVMQILGEFLVALNRIPRGRTAVRQSGKHCDAHRDRTGWQKALDRSVSGSKRRTRHPFCQSPILQEPSKKFKQLGHEQLHSSEIKTWQDSGSNLGYSHYSSGAEWTEASSSLKDNSPRCIIHDMPSLDSEHANEAQNRFRSAMLSTLFGSVSVFRVVRWFAKKKKTGWESLPTDLQAAVLQRVELRDLFRFKAVSKSCQKFIESDAFCESGGPISKGSFTAISYYIKRHAWQCSGFDLHSKSWRSLPTFSCLPPPDAELFKEYFVTGHGGLMCAEVSKLPKKGELVVFNPLTGKSKALPSLLHPRNPVLVHISVDSAQRSYKVIVAGSSTAGDEHLSRKMEVFDSSTSEWKETCDLPGPAFGLNEHQAGVCLDGTLFFISFLEGDGGRGVVAFDVEKGEWVKDMTCPIPFSSYSNTLQLVENDGKVYLFSEQERGASVEHCIDELEFRNPKAGVTWRKVVQVKKSGGRGLLVYPEHTCVGFGEGKLCIFNALSRVGAVYDMRDGRPCEVLEPPPRDQLVDNFFTLNPASFTLQPNFECDPGWKFPKRNLGVSSDTI